MKHFPEILNPLLDRGQILATSFQNVYLVVAYASGHVNFMLAWNEIQSNTHANSMPVVIPGVKTII